MVAFFLFHPQNTTGIGNQEGVKKLEREEAWEGCWQKRETSYWDQPVGHSPKSVSLTVAQDKLLVFLAFTNREATLHCGDDIVSHGFSKYWIQIKQSICPVIYEQVDGRREQEEQGKRSDIWANSFPSKSHTSLPHTLLVSTLCSPLSCNLSANFTHNSVICHSLN